MKNNLPPALAGHFVNVDRPTPVEDPRVLGERVALLYRNAPAGIATTVVISLGAYLFLLAPMAQSAAWLALSLLVSSWRAWMIWQYRRGARSEADASRWMEKFLVGVFAAGSAWGLLGASFFPGAPTEVQVGIILILAGMAAGAVGVFAVAVKVYAAFMLPTVVPLLAILVMMGERVFVLIAFMGVAFVAATLAFARNTGFALREAILLRFEHEAALARLAESERHLRNSEAQMRVMLQSLEGSGEAIFTKTLDGVVTTWNRAAERIYGYTAGEAIGKPLSELHHSELTEVEYAQVLRRIRHGEPTSFEARRRHKDGGKVQVLVSTSPIFSPDGSLIGETSISRDITEMKAAQLALARAERELRLIIDNTPAMICYVDRGYRYRMVNKAYGDLYGKGIDELLGRDFREVLDPVIVARVQQYIDHALEGNPVRYERVATLPGGEVRDLVVQYVPDFGEDGVVAGSYTLLTDVTELKRLERMKSEFVSTVSHELRTPLTSILGSLSLVAAGAAGAIPPEAREMLAIAEKNCDRLTRLINDILDVEKMESGRAAFDLRPADLMHLVDEAVEQNRNYAAERHVGLKVVERAANAVVEVDAFRFAQVMANLLSNAAKYSPANALVEIAIRRRPGGYRVSVRDRGPGIEPAFRERIFQRFSQSDASDARRVGGSGLGLAIAKNIVERFGGAIDFESTPGQGATFHLDLPEAKSELVVPCEEAAG